MEMPGKDRQTCYFESTIMKRNFEELELQHDQSYNCDGKPFHGVCVYRSLDGAIESEVSFIDGVQSGGFTDYHSNGTPSCTGTIANGVYHGTLTHWNSEGVMTRVETYEYGICTSRKEYSETGSIISEFEIQNDDPNFQLLLAFRKTY